MKRLKILTLCITSIFCFSFYSCQEIFTNSLGSFLYDSREPSIDSNLAIDDLLLVAQNYASDSVVLKAIFKTLCKKDFNSFSSKQKIEMLKIAATSSGANDSLMSTISTYLVDNTTDDLESIDEAGRNNLLNGFIKNVDTELVTSEVFLALISDADVLSETSSESLLFVSITLIAKGCEPYADQDDPVSAYITQAASDGTDADAIQDLVDVLITQAETNADSSGPFGCMISGLIELFNFRQEP